MYSIHIGGKVHDFNYKKLRPDHYAFNVGDIFIGQIFKMGRTWTAVGRNGGHVYPADGFATRYAASAFILKELKLERSND